MICRDCKYYYCDEFIDYDTQGNRWVSHGCSLKGVYLKYKPKACKEGVRK